MCAAWKWHNLHSALSNGLWRAHDDGHKKPSHVQNGFCSHFSSRRVNCVRRAVCFCAFSNRMCYVPLPIHGAASLVSVASMKLVRVKFPFTHDGFVNSSARVHKISTATTGEKCFVSVRKPMVLVHFTRTCSYSRHFGPKSTLPWHITVEHALFVFPLFFSRSSPENSRFLPPTSPTSNCPLATTQFEAKIYQLVMHMAHTHRQQIFGLEGIEQLFIPATVPGKKTFSFPAMTRSMQCHSFERRIQIERRGSLKCQKYQWFIRNESRVCSQLMQRVFMAGVCHSTLVQIPKKYQPATIVRCMCTNNLHKMRVKDVFFQILHKETQLETITTTNGFLYESHILRIRRRNFSVSWPYVKFA